MPVLFDPSSISAQKDYLSICSPLRLCLSLESLHHMHSPKVRYILSLLTPLMRLGWVRKLAHLVQESRRAYLRQSASRKLADQLRSTRATFIVRRGPFQGIELTEEGCDTWTFMPKVLGSYECELHVSFRYVLDRSYSKILNIGAAEGYYAVGLAKNIPAATVYAYEQDERRRSICRKNATINDVSDRVHTRGVCDSSELQSVELDSDSFVLCDIEGAERHLLDPEKVTGLQSADILLELHDNDRGATDTLGEEIYKRFNATHQVIPITKRPRYPDEYTEIQALEWDERPVALSEHRFLRNGWIFLKRRDD